MMNTIKSLGLETNKHGIAPNLFSSLLFLFFIQQITFLVESIYMLNLLHTSMDSKVLGILLLFLPALLYFIKKSKTSYIIIVALMLICILLSPVLPTPFRIFSSGLGAGLFLLYLGLQFSDNNVLKTNWGQAAALATLTSISFRAVGHTLDISVNGDTKFIGWFLVLTGIYSFYRIIQEYPQDGKSQLQEKDVRQNPGSWLNIPGLTGSILLLYFAFSSPGVIASWTEGNYVLINIFLSISIWAFMIFGFSKLLIYARLKELLLITNIVFLLLLLGSILLHRVSFPVSPESAPVIVGKATLFSQLITYFMLFFSPVLFINISIFSQNIKTTRPSTLAGPFLWAVLLIIVAVFMLIFSNVWGYTKPVSTYFRNQFHLPFLLTGLSIILPYLLISQNKFNIKTAYSVPGWSKIIYLFFAILCCSAVLKGNKKQVFIQNENINELTLMTYNIQQGVDLFGNKNYEGQFELIVEINPDIIGLQESDGSRISGGNSDVVRYFAEKLGYYSYFGPKTVTGTFGTAILSRFPLDSCRTIFTYSSKDEIGTAISNVSVGNQNITIINSHPAGNKEARVAHIDVVAELAKENKMVIALGDYNFRQGSPYYQKITSILNNAWLTKYPDAIGPVDTNKLDLTFENRKGSGGQLLTGGKQDMKNRIDHIFLSKKFKVVEAHYLPAPESGTDHPAHWAVVRW